MCLGEVRNWQESKENRIREGGDREVRSVPFIILETSRTMTFLTLVGSEVLAWVSGVPDEGRLGHRIVKGMDKMLVKFDAVSI